MADPATAFARESPAVASAETVSEGAYVHVYRGELDDETDETVRVLALAPEAADDDDIAAAFVRTVGQWRNPSTHPNVVTIHERGDRPRPWLATPSVAERPNGVRLSNADGRFSPGEVGAIISGAAEAIRNAGLYNTSHSALTPEHVWAVTAEDGVAGVVDEWGLERACRRAADERWLTPYTAPELVADPDAATAATDVYGLAAVAYFGLTGRPPVDPGADLEAALPTVDPAPPSEVDASVPAAADDVVGRSLAPDPAERHPSVHAFATALADALPSAPEADLSGIGAAGAAGASGGTDPGGESSDSGGVNETGGGTSDAETGGATEPASGGSTASESGGSTARRAVLATLGLGALGVGGWAATQLGTDSAPFGDGSAGSGGDSSDDPVGADASDGGAAAGVGDETPTPTARSGSGASGESVDGPVHVAFLYPEEADPYGDPLRRGAALAAQRTANDDSETFDLDVEFVGTNLETDATVERIVQLREAEDIDLFVGGLTEQSGAEIGRFAAESDALYLSTAFGTQMTGTECNARTVHVGTGTDQTATLAGAFAAMELESRVAFVYADFDAGQRVFERTKAAMEERDDSAEAVVERAVPLDGGEYASSLQAIEERGARTIVPILPPQPFVQFLARGRQAGVLDDRAVVTPSLGPWPDSVLESIGEPDDGLPLFRSVRWHPSLSTGDNAAFVEAYETDHDTTPTTFARRGYDSIRVLVRAIKRAGSADPSAVADTLSGGTFQTTLGEVRIDPTTNRAVNPVWIGEVNVGEDPGTDVAGQLLSPEEALPPADVVGCEDLESTASR